MNFSCCGASSGARSDQLHEVNPPLTREDRIFLVVLAILGAAAIVSAGLILGRVIPLSNGVHFSSRVYAGVAVLFGSGGFALIFNAMCEFFLRKNPHVK